MLSRRIWLRWGLGAALIVGGGLAGWQRSDQHWQRFRSTGTLAADSDAVLRAVGVVLLDGLLPAQEPEQTAALHDQMQRINQTILGFQGPVQQELHLLLQLLASTTGRRLLASLDEPWQTATSTSIAVSLQAMRLSSWTVRRQAYQALRDLHFAAWTAEPSHWAALGYPGPTTV